jgi:hypothetical protein
MAEQDAAALPFKLQDGEQVVQVCRRHWWFLWPRTILWLVIALAPIGLAWWALDAVGVADDLGNFFWIAALVWLGFWVIRILLNWYQYHHDVWVITNQRLVDSTRPTPFRHNMSTADLVNIQDMTIEKTGITSTILNYGDVVCQTAGSGSQFRISKVPAPDEVQHLVDKERDRERKSYS